MTSAAERLKAMLANALERVCILEAELEQLRAAAVEPAPEPDEPEPADG